MRAAIINRREVVGALTLLTTGFGLSACKEPSTSRPAAPTQITIGTFSKALGNAPYYIARHFRWLETSPALAGVTVNYTEYNDRPAIVSAFSRGELDLLFSAEIPSILIRAQGEDVRLVCASTYAAQEVLIPTASTIRAVSALRGKRVAVQAGTSSHFGLVRILNDAGLRVEEVRLQFMPAAEGKAAFEAGQLDAWAAWAPWVETQEVAGRGRALPGGNAVIYSVGTMRRAFMTTHAEQARAMVAAIQRAKTWMIQNGSDAQQIAAASLGYELPVVAQAWPKFHWNAQLSNDVVADFQAKAAFLAEQDLTRDGVTVNVARDLVDLSLQSNPR